MSVVIETTVGDITVDLFLDERPVACLNFVKLCKLKYFNYNLFHTVEQSFIAQTGDPTGSGDGGSSVWGLVEGPSKRFFEAEDLPKIKHSCPGLLSMVSVGKHLVGSQFFFTLGSDLTSLDGIHCVIGQVVEGQETLRKMNEAIVDEKFRPFQDIRITHTVILDDPFPDPRGFRVPSRSPSPSANRLQNGRIGADEDIDDTEGKSLEEIQEMLEEREAKARATILEIVGDLPDADMAPPENVLFVCKLNPVTTDDDLEIIFSRFGKVKSCEVIRDKKSGDSLQYAFVEFEKQESCEAAFLKMDNVLIDDRRIHVDFSQSVAKVKWRGKGRGVEGTVGRLDFNNLKDDDRRYVKRYQPRYRFEGKKQIGRRHIPIEERRRAREERHRERDRKEREERHNYSRSRYEEVRNDRDKRSGFERGDSYRQSRSSYEVSYESSTKKQHRQRKHSRSRSTSRDKKRISGRRNSPERKHREVQSNDRTHLHKDKQKERNVSKTNERKKKTIKSVKRRHSSSSSDSSDSDETSSDSSSQSSSSSSTSSSDEHKMKKKHSRAKASRK